MGPNFGNNNFDKVAKVDRATIGTSSKLLLPKFDPKRATMEIFIKILVPNVSPNKKKTKFRKLFRKLKKTEIY